MMLFKSVIKGILLFSMILSLECWAESRQIKEKIGHVYDIIAEFGEYKPHLRAKYIHKYDGKGNQIENTQYDSRGELKGKGIYKYDEKGKMTEEVDYDSQGKLTGWTTYEYDETGNMIEEASYYSEGKLMWKTAYKYDRKGNMVEKVGHHIWLRESSEGGLLISTMRREMKLK